MDDLTELRAQMHRQSTREQVVQNSALLYLQSRGIYAWRNNTGVARSGGRYIRYGKVGSSDVLGILPDGRFLAIECKRPGEKPTDAQREFLDTITSNGGVAFVAVTIDDVIENLAPVLKGAQNLRHP